MVKFVATGKEYDADEIGVLKLGTEPRDQLSAGDVGYIISGIKTSREVKVGDTITHVDRPCDAAISGFEDVKPMVFAGIYPVDADDYEDLSWPGRLHPSRPGRWARELRSGLVCPQA